MAGELNDNIGDVYWYHFWPPWNPTYHGHLIGDAAYAADWLDQHSFDVHGQIITGGSIGTDSWECCGDWWSEDSKIKFKMEVVQIKDETTGKVYTGDDIKDKVQFYNCHTRPQGSHYVDDIINLLWDIVESLTQHNWPNPFKYFHPPSSVPSSYDKVEATVFSGLSELRVLTLFWNVGWVDPTHTYTIKVRLWWWFTWWIYTDNPEMSARVRERGGIDQYPEMDKIGSLGTPVDYETRSVYRYITYQVVP